MTTREQLVEYLTRLGLHVEHDSTPGLLRATRRTALTRREAFHYYVPPTLAQLSTPDLPALPSGTTVVVPDEWAEHVGEGPQAILTYSDFLDQTIQADRLSQESVSDPKILEKTKVFVPQRVLRAGKPYGGDAVRLFFDDWLVSSTERLLVVLAPAGYGKTLLTYELARRLALAHQSSQEPPRQPLPFLIPFGEFRLATKFESLILTVLEGKNITDFTTGAFAYLVTVGRVVLFLDGFDELLEQRPEEARHNLREFMETLEGRGKVIVTARSTFFRTSSDVADFLEHYLGPEEVSVVDLLGFDANQRGRLISKHAGSQTEINRLEKIVESEAIREAMTSPLLLMETLEALRTPRGIASPSIDLDATPDRSQLFKYLEESVYERERERHAHTFSDSVQRQLLENCAAEMLFENVPGFEIDLIYVLATEAVDDSNTPISQLKLLTDHHFLTVDTDSRDVRFNHQVFREYFQAQALLSAVHRYDLNWALKVLNIRPLPEEVVEFIPRLSDLGFLERLLSFTERHVELMSERVVNNLGALCAAFNERALLQRLLNLADSQAMTLSFLVKDAQLSGLDWSNKTLGSMQFISCDLQDANFTASRLVDVRFQECNLFGANFTGASIEALSFGHGPRLYNRAIFLQQLSDQGAVIGSSFDAEAGAADDHQDSAEKWREQVIDFVRNRVGRLYVPGPSGTAASRWDTRVSEERLLAGISPAKRAFMSSKVLPEMVRVDILARVREHGKVTYELMDRAKDDCRRLIEAGELTGAVDELVDRLVSAD
jgi:hypothetical protein